MHIVFSWKLLILAYLFVIEVSLGLFIRWMRAMLIERDKSLFESKQNNNQMLINFQKL